MSRSQAIVKAIARLNDRYALTEVAEEHGAVLTLRRTDVLAITTAGTTITWQSALRNFQFTWAGANITIPADGWYVFSLNIQTSVALNDCLLRIVQAGNNVAHISMLGDVDRTAFTGMAVLYCTTGQAIGFNLLPSANVNVVVAAEGQPQQSPILNVVQLSGGIG